MLRRESRRLGEGRAAMETGLDRHQFRKETHISWGSGTCWCFDVSSQFTSVSGLYWNLILDWWFLVLLIVWTPVLATLSLCCVPLPLSQTRTWTNHQWLMETIHTGMKSPVYSLQSFHQFIFKTLFMIYLCLHHSTKIFFPSFFLYEYH